MDENDWPQCDDPVSMLHFLRNHTCGSERKAIYFALACLHNKRDTGNQAQRQKWIDFLVSRAEGLPAEIDFRSLLPSGTQHSGVWRSEDAWSVAQSWSMVGVADEGLFARISPKLLRGFLRSKSALSSKQVAWLRCIFGNPFAPVSLDPSWLTPTVTRLAASIYEQRAFDQMPVLGDALDEAGCYDAEVLKHCRSGGEHVRGCHVVDLILGKQ